MSVKIRRATKKAQNDGANKLVCSIHAQVGQKRITDFFKPASKGKNTSIGGFFYVSQIVHLKINNTLSNFFILPFSFTQYTHILSLL